MILIMISSCTLYGINHVNPIDLHVKYDLLAQQLNRIDHTNAVDLNLKSDLNGIN